jgi:hypothetical protein
VSDTNAPFFLEVKITSCLLEGAWGQVGNSINTSKRDPKEKSIFHSGNCLSSFHPQSLWLSFIINKFPVFLFVMKVATFSSKAAKRTIKCYSFLCFPESEIIHFFLILASSEHSAIFYQKVNKHIISKYL